MELNFVIEFDFGSHSILLVMFRFWGSVHDGTQLCYWVWFWFPLHTPGHVQVLRQRSWWNSNLLWSLILVPTQYSWSCSGFEAAFMMELNFVIEFDFGSHSTLLVMFRFWGSVHDGTQLCYWVWFWFPLCFCLRSVHVRCWVWQDDIFQENVVSGSCMYFDDRLWPGVVKCAQVGAKSRPTSWQSKCCFSVCSESVSILCLFTPRWH